MASKSRPPIVTVLGHVDHGKTTLLDALRKTRVQSREAGGITQSIGASKLETKTKTQITFIDTPGHAAFEAMRSRGARVADIALLVVAADAGVKPQTVEVINHLREVNIPYILVITKMDVASADPDSVKRQLEGEGVLLEGQGGNVPVVEVSAKTGRGLDDLLEMVELVAQVTEIRADEKGGLKARVIETGKDNRGLLVSVVVQEGTLAAGDEVATDGRLAKVRALFDDRGQSIKRAFPGDPALIMGFSSLPPVGAVVTRGVKGGDSKDSKTAEAVREVSKDEIPVVIKAANVGGLEAVEANLPEGVVSILLGVGEITESDVFVAKAANAGIFGFQVKTPTKVKALAKTEDVKVESFDVIYELFERLEEVVGAGKQKILGRAEIVQLFPHNKKKIAGCRVTEGVITKTAKLELLRGETKLGDIKKVISMRQGKEDINQAEKGDEFGILFVPQLDFEVGDVILSAE
jgi:translation initiation factor IF-2